MQVKPLEKASSFDCKTPYWISILKLPAAEQPLFVEIKSSGQPRLARDVNKLWRAIAQKGSAYGIFIAPYISPTSAEICAAEGIGYLDLAGNCRLCFGQVYIHKEGKPNPFSQKRELRSLYSPKSERILRVLLCQSHKAWKVKACPKQMLVWG